MKHNSAVSKCPIGPTRELVTNKTIFQSEDVMRELLLKEYVSEFAVKMIILVINDLQYPVLYAESVPEIIIEFVPGYLDAPTLQVSAVEQRPPLNSIGVILGTDQYHAHQNCQKRNSSVSHNSSRMYEIAVRVKTSELCKHRTISYNRRCIN